jgi:hypothetical protein
MAKRKETSRLNVSTKIVAGGFWTNHNRALAVKTALKTGGLWVNHNRALRQTV